MMKINFKKKLLLLLSISNFKAINKYENINKLKIAAYASATGLVLFGGFKVFKTYKNFEKDFCVLPENVKVDWVSKKISDFLKFFGFEDLYFEKAIGTVFRGDKSGKYRSEQYAKLKISDAIKNEIQNELFKIEFLEKVSFYKVVVNNKETTFHLKVPNENKTLTDYLKTLEKFKFEEKEGLLSGTYTLEDSIENKTLYSLLISNEGTREINKDFISNTKCPVMSWEYDMLYRLNITLKERLKDDNFRSQFYNSLYHFNRFISETHRSILLQDILKHDLNYSNKHSAELSYEFKNILNTLEINHQPTTTLEEDIKSMSKIVVETGNNLQLLIAHNQKSDNVFKHSTVPFIIQKLIADFNYFYKNENTYHLPNVNFNTPYLTDNFWCVLDANEQAQNIQIAINKGHFENRYYYFTEAERNEAKKIILNVLKTYIEKIQFEYIEKNLKCENYQY